MRPLLYISDYRELAESQKEEQDEKQSEGKKAKGACKSACKSAFTKEKANAESLS